MVDEEAPPRRPLRRYTDRALEEAYLARLDGLERRVVQALTTVGALVVSILLLVQSLGGP